MVVEHRSDGPTDTWHDTITDAPKHTTNIAVNEFDVQKTGSSTLVQIPEDFLSDSVPKLDVLETSCLDKKSTVASRQGRSPTPKKLRVEASTCTFTCPRLSGGFKTPAISRNHGPVEQDNNSESTFT